MRGRDHAGEASGDDRIINPDGETQEYLKAVIDAKWGGDRPDAE